MSRRTTNIATVGAVPQGKVTGVTFTPVEVGKPLDNYQALWVNDSEIPSYITDEGLASMKTALAAGKVIVFIGESNPGQVWSKFGFNYNEVLNKAKSNVRHAGFYVWQNTNGQYNFGIVGVTQDASDQRVLESLLEQTVNHVKGGVVPVP